MRRSVPQSSGTSVIQIDVLGIEVVQAIQNMAHDIPLLENKKTVVRVYLKPQGMFSPMNVNGVLQMKDAKYVATEFRSINDVRLRPVLHPDLESQRQRLRQSLNFVLPADAVQAGQMTFSLTSASPSLKNDPGCSVGGNGRTVTFEEGTTLRVCAIGLRVRDPATGAVHRPVSRHFNSLRSMLKRAFPASTLEWSTITIDAADGFGPPYGDNNRDLNDFDEVWQAQFIKGAAHLMAIRARDVDAGADRRTHYYGLVAHPNDFFVGAMSDVPATPRPDVVGLGPALLEGGLYGAHEMAHALGALHPGFCGQQKEDSAFPADYHGKLSSASEAHHGFDVGDGAEPPRLLRYDRHNDLMTYCEPTWVSAYTYRQLLQRIRDEDAMGPNGVPGSFLQVVARYDLKEGAVDGDLLYVFPTNTQSLAAPSEMPRVVVRGEDEYGKYLFGASAELIRRDAKDLHQESGAVQMTVPRSTALKTLRLLIDGTEVDYMTPEQGGDLVLLPENSVVLAPKEIGRDVPDTHLTIAWPPDYDPAKRHTVEARRQDDPWRTIAIGITSATSTVFVDETWFDPSVPSEVRVLVATGFDEEAIYRGPLTQAPLRTVQLM